MMDLEKKLAGSLPDVLVHDGGQLSVMYDTIRVMPVGNGQRVYFLLNNEVVWSRLFGPGEFSIRGIAGKLPVSLEIGA
jgi:hypothetical protein